MPRYVLDDAEQPSQRFIVEPEMQAKEAPKSYVGGLIQGFRDPIDAAAQLLEHSVGQYVDTNKINSTLGMPSATQAMYSARGSLKDMFGGEPAMSTRILGNVAALAPAATVFPATVPGALAGGAFYSAFSPVESGDFATEKAKQLGASEAGSLIGLGAGNVLGRIVSPKASVDPALGLLKREGISPLPGQALGGMAKASEEKLTSVLGVGDMVAAGQRRGIQQFNRAAYNRVLDPIKGQMPDAVGRDAIASIKTQVSDAYDAALSGMTIRTDRQFMQELFNLAQQSKEMVPERARQLQGIYDNTIKHHFSPDGVASGESFKLIDTKLGRFSRMFSSSDNPDVQQLGQALTELQAMLRNLARRSNPDRAPMIDAANEAWANFVRVQTAASRQGAKDGIFSPAQLSSAVRATDKSLRHGNFGQGSALMQDLSDAGQKILSSTYPDSGTPGRLLNLAVLGSMIADPVSTAAGIGGGMAAYSKPLSKMIMEAATVRPPSAPNAAQYLMRFGPFLGGSLGAPFVNQ